MKKFQEYVSEAVKVPSIPNIKVSDLDSLIGDKKTITKIQKAIKNMTAYKNAGNKVWKGTPVDGEIKKLNNILKILTS